MFSSKMTLYSVQHLNKHLIILLQVVAILFYLIEMLQLAVRSQYSLYYLSNRRYNFRASHIVIIVVLAFIALFRLEDWYTVDLYRVLNVE